MTLTYIIVFGICFLLVQFVFFRQVFKSVSNYIVNKDRLISSLDFSRSDISSMFSISLDEYKDIYRDIETIWNLDDGSPGNNVFEYIVKHYDGRRLLIAIYVIGCVVSSYKAKEQAEYRAWLNSIASKLLTKKEQERKELATELSDVLHKVMGLEVIKPPQELMDLEPKVQGL